MFKSARRAQKYSIHDRIAQTALDFRCAHLSLCRVSLLGIYRTLICLWGTRWHSWSRHCATSRKVADSIPDGFTVIFHSHNPSGRTMVLGLTQPLTEMSTRSISWRGGVKAAGALRLTTLPPSCAECLEIWEPQPPGTLSACPGV